MVNDENGVAVAFVQNIINNCILQVVEI